LRSIPGIQLSRVDIRWPRGINLVSIVLPFVAGLILALLILVIGPIASVAAFALVALPWLLKDIYRLFIWLIISWPILILYIRVPLPAGIPDLGYDRVLVLLLVCIFVIEALLLKRKILKITLLDILVIGYLIAQVITRLNVLWFGGVGSADLNGLLDIIIVPIILYWIVKNLLNEDIKLKWFLYALVIASFLVCLTGLYEQIMGVRIFKASISLGGWETQYIWEDVPGGRAAGAMGNPAVYGAVVGMGILASICILPHTKSRFIQIALVAVCAILLYGVIVCYTRSAWVSVIGVLFIAQFFISNMWKKTLPLIVIGLIFLLFIWNQIPGVSNIMHRAEYTNSLPVRFELIQLGWERFLEKPFMGWGSGALNAFGLTQVSVVSHNIYLTMLVDGGLFLFLAFFAVIVYLIIKAIRVYLMARKGSIERDTLVAVTGIVLIFLLSGLAFELRYFGYINVLFWISAGVIDHLGTMCYNKSKYHG
jgi:O-antigen ligase